MMLAAYCLGGCCCGATPALMKREGCPMTEVKHWLPAVVPQAPNICPGAIGATPGFGACIVAVGALQQFSPPLPHSGQGTDWRESVPYCGAPYVPIEVTGGGPAAGSVICARETSTRGQYGTWGGAWGSGGGGICVCSNACNGAGLAVGDGRKSYSRKGATPFPGGCLAGSLSASAPAATDGGSLSPVRRGVATEAAQGCA